jgi:hypothetical protein
VLPCFHKFIESTEILKVPGIVSRPLFIAARKTRIKLRKLIPVHLYPHFPGTAISIQPMAEKLYASSLLTPESISEGITISSLLKAGIPNPLPITFTHWFKNSGLIFL